MLGFHLLGSTAQLGKIVGGPASDGVLCILSLVPLCGALAIFNLRSETHTAQYTPLPILHTFIVGVKSRLRLTPDFLHVVI